MEKRYWDAEDYDNVIRTIEFHTPQGDPYPTQSDPETSAVFNKLTDVENISIVMEDSTLGLKHRSDFSSKMFEEYGDLVSLYSGMDREDKFIYDNELVAIYTFGMQFQILYFKTGNDRIIQESVDTANYAVKNIINRNEQTVVSNFDIYLDHINQEKSFSGESLTAFADAISIYFPKLIKTFPHANYSRMLNKIKVLSAKTSSEDVRKVLSELTLILEEKIKNSTIE